MLPSIDTTNQNLAILPAGGNAPSRKVDFEHSAKVINPRAADIYKSSKSGAEETSLEVAENNIIEKRAEKARNAKATEVKTRSTQDQVEINFTLSPEERDVFNAALTSEETPPPLSPEEKATLKKASERLSKFIEGAVSKNGERRDRVEKAMTEWYSRISKNELKGPSDLIQLLHSAASGGLDKMYE